MLKTKKSKIVAGLIALLALIGFMATYRKKIDVPFTGSDQTRGLKNNNPLNIRISHNMWKGKVKGTDSEFETFSSMMWGLRAALKNLHTYYHKHGLNTIRGIINRWSPPSENNTAAYIDYVSKKSGFATDQEVDFDKSEYKKIVKAMCLLESRYEMPDELFDEAWANI